MNVLLILAINIISGDLIGWNRARNTIFKAQMNRYLKSIPLVGQYNTFRLVKDVKNGEIRSPNDLKEKIMRYTFAMEEEKSRPNRRISNFRQFHRKKPIKNSIEVHLLNYILVLAVSDKFKL